MVTGAAATASTPPMRISVTPAGRFSMRLILPTVTITVGIASSAKENSPVFTATVIRIHTLRYHAALSNAQNSSPMELLRPSESSSAQLTAPSASGAIMHSRMSESSRLKATAAGLISCASNR